MLGIEGMIREKNSQKVFEAKMKTISIWIVQLLVMVVTFFLLPWLPNTMRSMALTAVVRLSPCVPRVLARGNKWMTGVGEVDYS